MNGLLDNTLVGEAHVARSETAMPTAGVLILGVGNLLMGDEGVGVHVLRLLEKGVTPVGVRMLDGGTGGINLLREFEGVRDIVLIDATRDGNPAGTVSFLQPSDACELPRGLGAHDFGLKDLFAVSALLGELPSIHLYTISVEEIRPMCMELSPAVAAAVPDVAGAVRSLACKLISK
ncbi:MAG: hydrogenase maturation protease [Luteolibacter sp.]|jgi:hydrogenase maturation protease|nr:hydrogenase maturation protease [Luteolibacter sp.]